MASNKFALKSIIAVLSGMLLASMMACTQPETARRVLEAQGFSDIRMQGYAFFRCGQDDAFHDKFIARSPKGVMVSGVVCGGFLKGATIRFD